MKSAWRWPPMKQAQRYNYDEQAANRAEQIRQMLAFSLTATKLNTEGETPEACLEFRGDLSNAGYRQIPGLRPHRAGCEGDLSRFRHRSFASAIWGSDDSYKITVLKGLPALDRSEADRERGMGLFRRRPCAQYRLPQSSLRPAQDRQHRRAPDHGQCRQGQTAPDAHQ